MATNRSRRPLREAQHGRLLSDLLRPTAVARRRAAVAPSLDGGDRLAIVETLLTVIGGAYCHLPAKRAAYAADPVQALELLRVRAGELSEAQFHLAITSIITGLRDAHTRYSGPASMQGSVAVLPFLVEQWGPYSDPRYVVSKVSDPKLIGDRRFEEGVVLEFWNGIPFARAVELHAERETGGRPDSRIARALETLTFRALEYGPPPDEEWVVIGYRAGRTQREVRIPWRIVKPERGPEGHRPGSQASRFMAADPIGEQIRRARKLMFSGALWEAELDRKAQSRKSGWLPTRMQDNLAARIVNVRGFGDLGYLRVWSFDVEDDDAFLAEVITLLEQLPQQGLVLDLRGNPGGLIWAAERMLQLFTPLTITPTRFSLLATPLTRAIARSPFNRLELEAWAASLEAALWTGEQYSQPLPITEPAWCNDIGQRYSGPSVCVVDANTYSSGDIFAAGFVDNDIGPLVSVGEATGGGGANVWTSTDMRDVLQGTRYEVAALPDGVQYTLAIRRVTRASSSDGLPVEDVGINGTPYAMTLEDLFEDNKSLLSFCAGQLDRTDMTFMQVETARTALKVTTRGLDEIEVYADARPVEPVRAVVDGVHEAARPRTGEVTIIGRRAGAIRQRRLVPTGVN